MKILYTKCLCGANKLIAASYAAQGYEIRVVNKNPLWRKEAKEYAMKLPFVVEGGNAGEVR